jgi:ferric-dicitrate binding protein FerR (iron transport regulator)
MTHDTTHHVTYDHIPDDRQLDRYLSGEASSSERAEVDTWIARDPIRGRILERLRVAGQDNLPVDLEAVRQQIERRTMPDASAGRLVDTRPTPPTRPGPVSGWSGGHAAQWAVAACLGLLAVLLPVVVHYAGHRLSDAAVTTYATRAGQRADITLPDGSHVMLNVASRLQVPTDFGRHSRTVRLLGEAYFSVAHTNGVPFIVRTPAADATVLGTTFDVRSYEAAETRLVVRDGRVAINGTVAGARDVVQVQPGHQTIVLRDQPIDAAISFTAGRLTLINVPFGSAIPDLERWYDVELHVTDTTVLAQHVTISAPAGSIEELARWLRTTFDARIDRAGRVVTVRAR